MTLDQMMLAQHTDKSSRFNNYAEIYERYLGDWRSRVFRLLEIGVGQGKSLRVWESFFPFAEITGLDVDARCETLARARARVIIGHQRNARLLRTLGSFEVVIDDGSHVWKDQIGSFRMLFRSMPPGGVYFVEDVQTSYWPNYSSRGLTAVQFFTRLVDDLNINGRLRHSCLANCNMRKVGQLRRYEGLVSFVHFYPGLIVIGRGQQP